jgi:SNF2 family DNA or RNA helicase
VLERARTQPRRHQLIGAEKLITEPVVALFDEMGAGKTKQIIDAACVLHERDEIDTVIVICPAAVRSVWFDQELGELAKHLWNTNCSHITEYHSRLREWHHGPKGCKKPLQWVITNYDFVRNPARFEMFKALAGPKTWLVLDESSAVKNIQAKQTKACLALRKHCGRVTILNGTPVSQNPGDMYAQGRILDEKILECKNWYHFRARYAVLGGFRGKQIMGWRDVEDIQRRFKPYVLRRLKKDCLDLPPKLDPVVQTVTLSDESWKLYKELREEMLVWLDDNTQATAAQAGVRAMRLAQITSGYLGGLIASRPCPCNGAVGCTTCYGLGIIEAPIPPRAVGSEKVDHVLDWIETRLSEDPKIKVLIWCRFRAEVERLERELLGQTRFLAIRVGKIYGGQTRDERGEALRFLDPRTTPDAPVVVIGTPASGSMGLNLTAAHEVIYVSNDYSLKTRLQSEDRVHRTGQTHAVSYLDLEAVGPKGQKTVDHLVLKSLRMKQDMASFTAGAWVQAIRGLEEEA